MASSDDYPPGLTEQEIIAYLSGKLARQRWESEVMQRRMKTMELDLADLRQKCEDQSQSLLNLADLPLKRKRKRTNSKNSSYQNGETSTKRQLCAKMFDQVKELKTEVNNLRECADEMAVEFIDELKHLRHCCRLHLEPKYVLDELVPESAKRNGYVLIQRDHLFNFLRVVTENVAAVATNLAKAASNT